MKSFTLTLLAGILLFASCDKTKENPAPNPTTPTVKSKKDLVIDGKWQWEGLAFVMNVNGKDSLIDAWAEVKDCDKDDIMTYTADGKGKIDEMTNKCTDDPQVQNITWELINNETQVKVTDDEGTHLLTIIELTEKKAVYKQTMDVGGNPIVIQQTFKNIK